MLSLVGKAVYSTWHKVRYVFVFVHTSFSSLSGSCVQTQSCTRLMSYSPMHFTPAVAYYPSSVVDRLYTLSTYPITTITYINKLLLGGVYI